MNGDEDLKSAGQIEDLAAIALNGIGRPARPCTAVAPSATTSRGSMAAISPKSHLRHTLISPALGRLRSRRLPRGSNLKC